MRLAATISIVIALSLLPRSAQAQMIDDDFALVLGLVGLVGTSLVAPFGAMVTTLQGEPSKEWGRVSLAIGAIATTAGAITLLVGAHADEHERSEYYVPGGIMLGVGINGLLWGTLSEATLPDEDPGIPGRPRPASTSAALTFGGVF